MTRLVHVSCPQRQPFHHLLFVQLRCSVDGTSNELRVRIMNPQNPDSPVRPPRPAFLYLGMLFQWHNEIKYANTNTSLLDPDSDNFDDQHIEYYPVEHLDHEEIDDDVIIYDHRDAMPPLPPALHDPALGHSVRDSVDAPSIPSSIPASVRSFSRDSLGHAFSFAFPRARRHGDSVDTDDAFARPLACSSPDASSRAESPPVTPTYGGMWPTMRSGSRSPLACPPLYSPTETVIGTPDLGGKKPASSYGFKDEKPKKGKFKSNALLDIDTVALDKPWLGGKKEALGYVSYWLTWSMVLFMAGASALITLVDLNKIRYIGDLCMVLEDNFDNGIDRSIWFHEVDMGGFGYVFCQVSFDFFSHNDH